MSYSCLFFFCNDTATTEIYTYLHTLSLHDALPICPQARDRLELRVRAVLPRMRVRRAIAARMGRRTRRSEEHTSELQSLMRISYAVFCLKKKKNKTQTQNQDKKNTRKKQISLQ